VALLIDIIRNGYINDNNTMELNEKRTVSNPGLSEGLLH
jgi:hypothetical protein